MFGRKSKGQAPLRDDIAEAGANVTRAVHGKTLRRLESKLINGERVRAISEALQESGRAGLLVLTTYRVLFTVESVAGVAQDAVALERVSSVHWERKTGAMLAGGTLTVSTPGRSMVFRGVSQQFGLLVQSVAA